MRCMCGTEVPCPDTSSVGDRAKATLYTPVITHDGILWLCPKCVAVLKPHTDAIAKYFGDKANSLSWYAFWRAMNPREPK